MFRIVLIAVALFATIANGATVRYEWLNEPAKQGGKNVTGWIEVQIDGDLMPAEDRISIDEITDWKIQLGDRVIRCPKDGSGNGVGMRNQNLGRNELRATPKGLFMVGEGGSFFELEQLGDGVAPYIPYQKIRKDGIGGNVRTGVGPKVRYYFAAGVQPHPWNQKYEFRSLTDNDQPDGFDGNAIQIGVNPRIVTSPEPDDPNPPSPVDPVDLDRRAKLRRLSHRLGILVAEVSEIKREIDSLATGR